MGASEWISFAPYQDDIEAVLAGQRQREFEEHRFFDMVDYKLGLIRTMDHSDHEQSLEHPRYAVSPVEFERLKSLDKVDQVEDLVLLQGGQGTHCLIDIDGIADDPAYRMAIPLSESQLIQVFGSSKPTKDVVEERMHELSYFISTWMAVFFAVYENDSPAEICFYGITGD